MILGVSIMLIVTLAIVGMLASVISGQNLTRNDQNRINAFQTANAGVDRALWRIDSQKFTGGSITAVADGFRETFTAPDDATYEVTLTRTPAGQDRVWTVRSVGTDKSGRQRQAVATVEARSLFTDGFFTLTEFTLTGSNTNPTAYRSTLCPNGDPRGQAAPCQLAQPVPGFLGTNGVIDGSNATIEDFKANWAGFNMYGRGTQDRADADCAGGRCAPKAIPITDALEVELPDKTPFLPKDCNFIKSTVGTTVTIKPGRYLCTSLNLGPGTYNVSALPADADPDVGSKAIFYLTGSFGVAAGTTINQGAPSPRFQVYQEPPPANPDGTPAAYSGTVCGQGSSSPVEIWGLLYTPGLGINCNGVSGPEIYGAVFAQLFGGTGLPSFKFHWDVDGRGEAHNGRYVVSNWRECPPSNTTC